MALDWQVCSRARLSRDARFDGKFFIAVTTSRVYCRPICPARNAHEEHVRYYATAAAAEAAGFRPCLRCRPECSPGTPAWMGTSNTVSRALRLIAEGGLDERDMEAFAAQLGIGPRHLRRLFVQYLGAPPSAVAHTRRLQFAKKLIDETDLPMTQVALASGFGCVRRFNAAIQSTYHRTPTRLRQTARHQPAGTPHEYLFRLHYRPPYAWKQVLAFLAARATPGVEAVEGSTYRRTIALRGHAGSLAMTPEKDLLVLRLQFREPRLLFAVVERVRAMFDLNADWQTIASRLRLSAPLAAGVKRCPGLRVPGCWDGFELTVRAILGQQVSVAAATTMAGRLAQRFGEPVAAPNGLTHLFPAAGVLAEADLESVGITRGRATAIRALARAVADEEISFEGVVDVPAFLERLEALPGIGPWTAQYVAMRALGEPDAFPCGDGALQARCGGNARAIEDLSQAWRPWRAYAAMILWTCGQNGAERNGRERAGSVPRRKR
jgi:AraC family transcriptional regulator, regulatory protein of adaptative response / DNA-3-methyladenine glycosylase II